MVSRILSSVRVVEQVEAGAEISVVGRRVVVMVRFCVRNAVEAGSVETMVCVMVEISVRGVGVGSVETSVCVTVVSWTVVIIWVTRSVGAARAGRVETSVSVSVVVWVV